MNKHSKNLSAPQANKRPTQGGVMLYDVSRAGNASADWFDLQAWIKKGAATRAPAGRGDAFFIQYQPPLLGREKLAAKDPLKAATSKTPVKDNIQHWVLRHYCRGGLPARLSRDLYLWEGEEKTRPFAEWRLLADLYSQGLPVPPPIAAWYRRTGPLGLFYRGDLITERIAGGQPLSSRLAAGPLLPYVWEKIGRCIRQFHDAGVRHADLNAHNVLIVEPATIFLIDFDRSDIRKAERETGPDSPQDKRPAWKTENIERFHRSLTKIARALPSGRFSESDWQAVLRGYG